MLLFFYRKKMLDAWLIVHCFGFLSGFSLVPLVLIKTIMDFCYYNHEHPNLDYCIKSYLT